MIKRRKIKSNTENQDRLTSLPNELISQILSLLPLETAAATSVLSTQWWRNPLWTHRSHLNFEFEKYGYSDDFKVYMSAVDYILKKLISPKFLTFHLHNFPHPDWDGECRRFYEYLHSWFLLLADRNVEKISLRSKTEECGEDVWLPSTLFEIQSLKELVIWGDYARYDLKWRQEHFRVDLQLPNLKKIELRNMIITRTHDGLMKSLWEGCPHLEYLYLEFNLDIDGKEAGSVEVNAPNLKYLEMNIVRDSFDGRRVIFIEAPKLEAVKLSGGSVMYDFQEKPSSVLRYVNIAFDDSWWCESAFDAEGYMMLFQGISRTRSLCLAAWTFASFSEIVDSLDGYQYPVFPNLVDLTVIFSSKEYISASEMKLPVCLLANVKIIKISKLYDGDDKEIKLMGNLLSNAPLLKQLLVYFSCGASGKCRRKDQLLCNEYSVCTSLFMLPRVSLICEIKFYGCHVIASSKNFKDGKLYRGFIDQIATPRSRFLNITNLLDDQASGM